MIPNIRQICALRYGGRPCIDTGTGTEDCVEWCPLLRRKLVCTIHNPHIDRKGDNDGQHDGGA